jgi:hypothetical protein
MVKFQQIQCLEVTTHHCHEILSLEADLSLGRREWYSSPSLSRLFISSLAFRREISQPHSTNDAQIFVHNGQILEVMLAHDFPCLIQRLIFEAIIHFLLYHDFANKRRSGFSTNFFTVLFLRFS